MKKMLDRVWRFFSKIFRKEVTDTSAPKKKQVGEQVKRIRRKALRMDLIKCIEVAFEGVAGKVHGMSWVHPDTRRAVRKLGPWVPYSAGMEDKFANDIGNVSSTKINPRDTYPAIFVIDHGWLPIKELPEDQVAQDLSYAIRLEKPPWDVLQGRKSKNYVFYEHGRKFGQKKAQWVNCYFSINTKTGRVEPLMRLSDQSITVPKRNGKPIHYTRKEWCEPLARCAPPESWGKTEQERINRLRKDFIWDFEWWRAREQRWSASARKGNDRVTFSVEKKDTKHFFKDRDRTAITPSGQRKKIIHHVREHKRRVKGKTITVREHIRGLRSFSWNGFWVNVTAPKFHAFSLQKFDIPALDESDFPVGVKSLPASKWAGELANLEDNENVRVY